MNSARHYAKYQVYFFLYLAVVCELLIIIVERDDAESALLAEQERLRDMVRKVVLQLANSIPVAVTSGSAMMRVGETRAIRFAVMGLGPDRQVTVSPRITVRRDGRVVDTLRFGRDIRSEFLRNENGEQAFVFDFRPGSSGRYTFEGVTGTDFAGLSGGGKIRIGDFEIERAVFEQLTGMSADTMLRRSEHVTSSMAVTVVSDADPLSLDVADAETAAGFEVAVPVSVSGTDPSRVSITPSSGTVIAEGAGLVWKGSFAEPGKHRVTLSAHDNRGEGTQSAATAAFTVSVSDAAGTAVPQRVFVHETFRARIGVAGLTVSSKYKWQLLQDGREVLGRSGQDVEFKPVKAGNLVLRATYDGKPYSVKGRGSSEFVIRVEDTPYRIDPSTFVRNGEYPITQKFEVEISRYGRRRSEYSVPVQQGEITLSVEDEAGRDLLDDVELRTYPAYTLLIFSLKGKVSTEGTPAIVSISAGNVRERYPLTLYRDETALK
ncbi:MAG: hypothetical protein HY962_13980 [Ignavibacteriae bacterium]|nr:hypothetical protein [Ignavibacteriota bacterium]